MLKKISKIVILCLATITYAQETEILDGLFNPLALYLDNDDLFMCEHAGNNIGQGKISKINLTDVNPVQTEYITNLVYPRSICLYGNDLYFSRGNSLYHFNINDANPTENQVVYTGTTTYAMIEIDGFLYLGGNSGITKINLNSTNPNIINVINLPVRPLAFEYREGLLYFGYGNQVGRIDPTDTNPVLEMVVDNLVSNIYSMIFYENNLLLGMSLVSKIAKVNFNQEPLVAEEFLNTSIGRPSAFAVWNDELYIAGGPSNNIFKIENLNTLLSVDKQNPMLAVRMYPNPSIDTIHILGIDDTYNFEILNLNGQQLLKGQRHQTEDIDVSALASGTYLINLSDGMSKKHVLRFIKK